MMERRGFLSAIAAGALPLWMRPFGQDSTRRGAADPLSRPDVVGATRRVVDSAQNDPVVVGVERRIRCTCGCGLDVFTCRTTDFTCSYSPALHDEVVEQLRRTGSADRAIAALVAKYGESILMAPKARGFGVVGYLLPGTIVVVAGLVLAALLVRRTRRPAESAGSPGPGPAPDGLPLGTPADLARLERALDELET